MNQPDIKKTSVEWKASPKGVTCEVAHETGQKSRATVFLNDGLLKIVIDGEFLQEGFPTQAEAMAYAEPLVIDRFWQAKRLLAKRSARDRQDLDLIPNEVSSL